MALWMWNPGLITCTPKALVSTLVSILGVPIACDVDDMKPYRYHSLHYSNDDRLVDSIIGGITSLVVCHNLLPPRRYSGWHEDTSGQAVRC